MSYAQHHEDLRLLNLLSDVRTGFYIDVGAESPLTGTVTRLFYEAGWSGINIEPVPYWFDQLQAHRPRDQNYNLACGASARQLLLHEVHQTGLSTVRQDFAERAVRDYKFTSSVIQVPCVRLDSLPLPPIIHFLKIDVEGSEREVLQGIDLTKHRPWVILLEATEPNSAIPTHQEWEDILFAAEYVYHSTDGVNRYYLSKERAEVYAKEF